MNSCDQLFAIGAKYIALVVGTLIISVTAYYIVNRITPFHPEVHTDTIYKVVEK